MDDLDKKTQVEHTVANTLHAPRRRRKAIMMATVNLRSRDSMSRFQVNYGFVVFHYVRRFYQQIVMILQPLVLPQFPTLSATIKQETRLVTECPWSTNPARSRMGMRDSHIESSSGSPDTNTILFWFSFSWIPLSRQHVFVFGTTRNSHTSCEVLDKVNISRKGATGSEHQRHQLHQDHGRANVGEGFQTPIHLQGKQRAKHG